MRERDDHGLSTEWNEPEDAQTNPIGPGGPDLWKRVRLHRFESHQWVRDELQQARGLHMKDRLVGRAIEQRGDVDPHV
jgi:hypothetical protein